MPAKCLIALTWYMVHGYNRSGAKYLTVINKILILIFQKLPCMQMAFMGCHATLFKILIHSTEV